MISTDPKLTVFRQKHKDLSEQQKCEFLTSIATYPCIAAAHQSKESVPSSIPTLSAFHCRVCDSERTVSDAVVPWNGNEANDFRDFLLDLLPRVSRSPPLRISYLLAVRRFLYHEHEIKSLSIKSSSIGELCLHSLKAASRELRITTGSVSPKLVDKIMADLWKDIFYLASYAKLWMFRYDGRTSSSSSSA